MKHKKIIQSGSTFLVTLLLLVTLSLPVHASSSKKYSVRYPQDDPTAVNVYLPISAMQQQFQQSISQTLPDQFNQALTQQTKSLPLDIRPLVAQLVGELFQPSATLTRLTPRQNGLVASISISLFPKDPHPAGFSMLLVFNKINSTSAEVDVKAVPGQPAPPATGNLSTFNVSLGLLNSIGPTPRCGESALKMNISTPQAQGQQPTPHNTSGGQGGGFPLFIEVPAAAFQAGAAGAGSMDIGAGFSAQNIQVSLQGHGMVVSTQIAFSGLSIGSTMTTVQLSAANGKLVGTVVSTQVNFAGLSSFPLDAFNQDIQQQINQELSGMIGNMLNVTSVNFGPTAAIPCATPGNMLLGGTSAGF